jgi:hypothetical protein
MVVVVGGGGGRRLDVSGFGGHWCVCTHSPDRRCDTWTVRDAYGTSYMVIARRYKRYDIVTYLAKEKKNAVCVCVGGGGGEHAAEREDLACCHMLDFLHTSNE